MADSLITPEIRAMVGQEVFLPGTEPVEKGIIKRYTVAVGDPNPLYRDEEYARKTRHGGIIAPPTFVFDANHRIEAEVGEDGRPLARVKLPPPLNRIARAGNEYEFHKPARPGDIISARRKITNIFEKEGRTGGLVFVEYETTYTNQKQEVLGINRERLVFFK